MCIEPLTPILSSLNTADVHETKTNSNNKTVRISCPLDYNSNKDSEWNPIYEKEDHTNSMNESAIEINTS